MEECKKCESPAQFIKIEGGNYYCASCVLKMYEMKTK